MDDGYRKQVLILYNNDEYGNREVVHIIVVLVHDNRNDWLSWLEKAREKAKTEGLRLFNWGSAEGITHEQALDLIA